MSTAQGTYIVFRFDDDWPGRANLWSVETKDGELLGFVKWFGRWRKYGFFPRDGAVFEEICLREISQFIVDRTREHKAAKAP